MFDLPHLQRHCAAHGPIIRVVTAAVKGSGPREVGAQMLVWHDGQSGTIGGGQLEFAAAAAARAQLKSGADIIQSHHPLGPALGQCCGGAVTLVSERITMSLLRSLEGQFCYARPLVPAADMPLVIRRSLADARNQGLSPTITFSGGWLLEALQTPRTPLWIWGAGHVGRALVNTLAPLPDFDVTWVDTAQDRFPPDVPTAVTPLVASDPARVVPRAPQEAQHLIVTYSHALDLELCHQLLRHRFGFAGLIGSRTKWARFRSRLSALGHSDAQISRITCPIGAPELGKHPQAIAIGVASKLLRNQKDQLTRKDRRA
ncbi:xanthine dehydrogenase accessory protein XdhC [Cognatishimia sp. SS12]|uniref:xanthine dehydrogenase accessory protein XdhC n=1 Tax=Cognatishimia sp. SS12 TaxID=2979465 RepID=UPI00232A9EEA|nr:xanthine dehydrogenase accessory protein XdhC [Cognatishimia sp. SS12]MDC0738113.1 xanthine dehydrogenase accessory protein XdhC [Cognatishimia sp. SS12]